MTDDFLSALELQAHDYRYRMRLTSDSPIEVHIPHGYALQLIEQYGSLEAAVNTVFRPGAVKLIDAYWHEHHMRAAESVERKLTQFDHPRSDVNELTRIAFSAG